MCVCTVPLYIRNFNNEIQIPIQFKLHATTNATALSNSYGPAFDGTCDTDYRVGQHRIETKLAIQFAIHVLHIHIHCHVCNGLQFN